MPVSVINNMKRIVRMCHAGRPFIVLCLLAWPVCAGVVPYPTEIAADTPDAYWRLAETSGTAIADSSGNSRTGTISGTYTLNQTSLLLNNTANPSILFTAGSFTSNASFWSIASGASCDFLIKFTSLPSGTAPTFVTAGTQGSTTEGAFIVRYNAIGNNDLQYLFNYSGGATGVSYTWIPTLNQTYHIAVTHDYASKTITIYIDGNAVKTSVVSQTALAFTNKAVKVAATGYSAYIDEPAIYPSALSASRVRAHFAAARGADATQTTWYAGPSGSIYATGATGDPLDLNAAFNFSLIQPGSTLIVKDGTYTAASAATGSLGIWTVQLAGTTDSRITIQTETRFGALLDGADRRGHVVQTTGSYVDLVGFEIRKHFATRTTSLINTSTCPILNSDGQVVGGDGISNTGQANHFYYNYVHDVLGNGFSDFGTTQTEVYGNIVAHNGWTAPRTLGGPDEGNGHGIYTNNLGVNGQKKIEENIFFDAYSSPVAAKGSGAAYIENYLLRGNVCAYGGFGYDVGGGIDGIHDITIDSEMIYHNTMTPGFNSSANRDATITNNYIFSLGGVVSIEVQDFNSFIYTGNESGVLTDVAGGGLFHFRIRTGHAYNESTVNNNIYWQSRTGTASVAFYANTTSGTLTQATFAAYKTATGWDASSTWQNPSPNNFALPTTTKTFTRSTSRYQAGRMDFVVYNWHGDSTASLDLTSAGLVNGQTYYLYNGLDALATPVSGIYNSASPTISVTLNTSVSTRYGDAANSPAGTLQYNVWTVYPGDANPSAPGDPTSVTLAWVSSTSLSLTWSNPDSSATGGTVECSTDNGANWTNITSALSANATSYSVTGRTPQIAYVCRVQRSNGSGVSLWGLSNSKTTTRVCKYGTGCV